MSSLISAFVAGVVTQKTGGGCIYNLILPQYQYNSKAQCVWTWANLIDETLPNFIERKLPWRERKGNKGQGPMSEQANSPTKGGPQGGKGTTKNWTLHQFAWSKSTKRKGGKPYKTPNLEEPSHAITAHLDIEAVCTLYSAIDTFCLYTLMKESYSIAFDLLTNPITPT